MTPDRDDVVKDGEIVRVPMMLMDATQRAVAAPTKLALCDYLAAREQPPD